MRKRHKHFASGLHTTWDGWKTASSQELTIKEKPHNDNRTFKNPLGESFPLPTSNHADSPKVNFEEVLFKALLIKFGYGDNTKKYEDAEGEIEQALYELDYGEDPDKTIAVNGIWKPFTEFFEYIFRVIQKYFWNFEELFLIAVGVEFGEEFLFNRLKMSFADRVILMNHLTSRLGRAYRKRFSSRKSEGDLDWFIKLNSIYKESRNFIWDFAIKVFGPRQQMSLSEEIKNKTIKKKYLALSKEERDILEKAGKNIGWSKQSIKLAVNSWLVIWSKSLIQMVTFGDTKCLNDAIAIVSRKFREEDPYKIFPRD